MATKSKPRRSRKTTKKRMGITNKNKRNRSMTRRNRLNRVKRKKDKRLKDKTKMKKYKRGKNKTKRIKGGVTDAIVIESTKLDQKFKFTLVKRTDKGTFFGQGNKIIGKDILYLTDPCGSNFVGNSRKTAIKKAIGKKILSFKPPMTVENKFEIVYGSMALHSGAGGASGSIYNSIFPGQKSQEKFFSIQRPDLYLIDVLYSEILTYKKFQGTPYSVILLPALNSINIDAFSIDRLLTELRELRTILAPLKSTRDLYEQMKSNIEQFSTIKPVFVEIERLLISNKPFMALTPDDLQSTPIIKFYRNHMVPDDNDEKAICVIHQMGVDFRVAGNIATGSKNLCRAYLNIRKCMELIASRGVTPKVDGIEQPCLVTYLSLGIFSGTINKQKLVDIAERTMNYDQSGEASIKTIKYSFSGSFNEHEPSRTVITIPDIGSLYSDVYEKFDESLDASITAGIKYFTQS